MENEYYPFINTPLPYEYNALEPFIDEQTMRLHHSKHLQTYINNLNEVLSNNPRLQKMSLEQLITNSSRLPQNVQTSVRNNAGGVYNHRFYFNELINPAEKIPAGKLAEAINNQFTDFNNFKNEFKKAVMSVFGSGYAWLVLHNNKLKIITTPNQNTPLEQKMCPILSIDVWEHAYYLKHYNLRADYIDDWFNIINWANIEENYLKCLK